MGEVLRMGMPGVSRPRKRQSALLYWRLAKK